MKKGRKTNIYRRIFKLIENGSSEEHALARELVIANVDRLHPDEWNLINNQIHWRTQLIRVDAQDIQQTLYDKRQQEREANKGDNSK